MWYLVFPKVVFLAPCSSWCTQVNYSHWSARLVGYADDTTPLRVVPRPSDGTSVTDSLNADLAVISAQYLRLGMKLNAGKAKAMTVSRSRTLDPQFPNILINGVQLESVGQVDFLGMIVDFKLTVEPHVRSIAKRALHSLGVLHRAWRIVADLGLTVRCFWLYLLLLLKYCSPVWNSAAESHLNLLDRVVKSANFLPDGRVSCNVSHRRDVASLCMLYKI